MRNKEDQMSDSDYAKIMESFLANVKRDGAIEFMAYLQDNDYNFEHGRYDENDVYDKFLAQKSTIEQV